MMVAPRWRPCADVKAGVMRGGGGEVMTQQSARRGGGELCHSWYEYETPYEIECGIYVVQFHTFAVINDFQIKILMMRSWHY